VKALLEPTPMTARQVASLACTLRDLTAVFTITTWSDAAGAMAKLIGARAGDVEELVKSRGFVLTDPVPTLEQVRAMPEGVH
jgi:hypothetical protein